jgi:hypothetical protein
MPGTTFPSLEAAAGVGDDESFPADADAHASVEARSTTVAAVAILE